MAELEPLSFSESEFAARCGRVRNELTRRDLDGVLVFRPSSVEYLCGFHTVNPYPAPLLVTHDDLRLYVLDIELARALASSTGPTINFFLTRSVGGVAEDSLSIIIEDVRQALGKGRKLAVELNDVRVPSKALSLLTAASILVQDGKELVERLRLILSPAEIEKMKRAAQVTQRGVAAAIEGVSAPGATDSSVAAAIATALIGEANSSCVIPPIVATGRRGGVHHSTWRNVPLAEGVTFCEFAGTDDRYHAPVMVTIATRPPNTLERRLEELAQAALAGVLEEVRPGRSAGEVADAVTARVGELKNGDVFHWNFGYSVGLAHPPTWADTADWSIISANQELLHAGMAFHVPASFRSFGQVLVGMSHTIALEESGPCVLTGNDARIISV